MTPNNQTPLVCKKGTLHSINLLLLLLFRLTSDLGAPMFALLDPLHLQIPSQTWPEINLNLGGSPKQIALQPIINMVPTFPKIFMHNSYNALIHQEGIKVY